MAGFESRKAVECWHVPRQTSAWGVTKARRDNAVGSASCLPHQRSSASNPWKRGEQWPEVAAPSFPGNAAPSPHFRLDSGRLHPGRPSVWALGATLEGGRRLAAQSSNRARPPYQRKKCPPAECSARGRIIECPRDACADETSASILSSPATDWPGGSCNHWGLTTFTACWSFRTSRPGSWLANRNADLPCHAVTPLANSQPSRYCLRTYWSAASQFVARSVSASHSSRLPLR